MANFEKLNVYQKALEFSYHIYQISKKWPQNEIYGITSQIKRASLSIALNIAEGSSRSKKDFAYFLVIARGSCYECIALLTFIRKIGFIQEVEYKNCYNNVEELAKMINALRSSITIK